MVWETIFCRLNDTPWFNLSFLFLFWMIKQLWMEKDPVLHGILRDGVAKYLGEKDQTPYKVDKTNNDDYWQLQKNQKEIGLDNLTRGKFPKHWRILQQNYKKKNTKVQKFKRCELNANALPKYQQIRRKEERNQTQSRYIPTSIRQHHGYCTRTVGWIKYYW